jgi:hypothetical protein
MNVKKRPKQLRFSAVELFDGVKPLPRILEQFNLDQQPS